MGQGDVAPTGRVAESQDDPSVYTLLLEIEPGAQWIYRLRVEACTRLKQWDQVAADSARRIIADPTNPHFWYAEAAARLGAGDVKGYSTARAGMLAQFRDTKSPSVAAHVCYVCAAVPAQPNEAEAFLRLAEFAVIGTPFNPRIRGAMNYRAGKYKEAISDFERSAPVFPRRAWDWLFMAMAHYKLGHTEEAKHSLKNAEAWIERAERIGPGGSRNPWFGWYEPLEVEQLLKEARALVRCRS
jgi:tetratricopeptide (TPR) repeat protein